MTGKMLWSPSTIKNNLDKFIEYINIKKDIHTYADLHKWSVEKKEIFWDKFWQFSNIIGKKNNNIFKNSEHFIDTKFFETSLLNYAENCLQINNDEDAIIFYNEQGESRFHIFLKAKISKKMIEWLQFFPIFLRQSKLF